MEKSKYLIIALPANGDSNWGWAEELCRTTGITHTFKRAYEVGLFLAGITAPEMKYRKALEAIKKMGAVEIKQAGGEQRITIVHTRVY